MSERSLASLPDDERRAAIADGLITIKRAAATYGRSEKELWRWINEGVFPVERKGRRGRNGSGTVQIPVRLLVDHINEQIGAQSGVGV